MRIITIYQQMIMFPHAFRLVVRRNSHYLRRLTPSIGSNNVRIGRIQPHRSTFFFLNNARPGIITGYYVVFPVIPDETVDNNKFVSNMLAGDWPPFQSATPREFYEGTVRIVLDCGATAFDVHEKTQEDSTMDRTFESIFEPLMQDEMTAQYAFSTLLVKMLTDWPSYGGISEFRKDLHHITQTMGRDGNFLMDKTAFYNCVQDIYADRSNLQLNRWQTRLVEWYLNEMTAYGTKLLTDRKNAYKVSASKNWAHRFKLQFIKNIMFTYDDEVFPIYNRELLSDAPPDVLRVFKDGGEFNTGPWVGRMMPQSMYALLTYCRDRSIRADAWHKWISRSSFLHSGFYNNSVVIEEIRYHTARLTRALGFSSIAHHHLQYTMAGSPETVKNFIAGLKDRLKPAFNERYEVWNEFAKREESMQNKLQQHDLFYMCRREAEMRLDVRPLELMEHFPFWSTFDNLVKILSNIMNLHFEDISNSDLERCSPDVRIYAVKDVCNDEHLGRLYVDPFPREGKLIGQWTSIFGRPANIERNQDKIVYLISSVIAPSSDMQPSMHYQELGVFFFHFGRILQWLISRSPYTVLTAPAQRMGSDWDAADMFPNFVRFFLYKPKLLGLIASPNQHTGVVLTDERLINACFGMARTDFFTTYRTLFWSDIDITIYSMKERKDKFWLDLYTEKLEDYFGMKRERNDYQPCSFTPIFTTPLLSMYYSKLWSEMLALDIQQRFEQEDDIVQIGRSLKEMLALGASETQADLFRQFMQRDPSIGALCDFYDPPLIRETLAPPSEEKQPQRSINAA